MKFKKFIAFIALIAVAIALGKVLGNWLLGVPALAWLGNSFDFTMEPVTIDITVLSVTFGISFNLNILQAAFMIISMFIYPKITAKLGD